MAASRRQPDSKLHQRTFLTLGASLEISPSSISLVQRTVQEANSRVALQARVRLDRLTRLILIETKSTGEHARLASDTSPFDEISWIGDFSG